MKNFEKEIFQQPAVLRGLKSFNNDVYGKLIDRMIKNPPSYIYFAARGTSDHACIYAQYMFGIYLGIPCALATPSVISRYDAELNLSGALVIGVSQSGKAEDVLSVLEHAKKCGAPTVAVTNDSSSPMALAADYSLDCNAGPERSIAATKTFTSQMYILAMLCARWAERIGRVPPESTGLASATELVDALEALPDAIDALLETVPARLETMIARYRFLDDAFVLARGINYPIALEGALKVLETNGIKVKGYSISDFYHGPLAQIGDGTLAIVLAADGRLYSDAVNMFGRINEIEDNGADVIIISDVSELTENAKLSVKLPAVKGSDSVSPFLFAITMQLFALKLTDVKGIDPDASRVLKKVTITK